MTSIDFNRVSNFIDIPENALRILSKSEKEIKFNLNLLLDRGKMLEADCYVAYYNTVRGPAKGGIRMSEAVTLEETRDLAERMVWKCALAGIPFGGGKSGISLDPNKITFFQKVSVMKEFVHMMELELKSGAYIPAPDMGTSARDMAIIYGETHILESVTGKPPRIGGLPGREEATGRGVMKVTLLSIEEFLKQKPSQASVAVQGFGNVGSWAALFLRQAGAKVVAISDYRGGFYSKKGLNIEDIFKNIKVKGQIPSGVVEGEEITNKELLSLPVDILIPAAIENVIAKENVLEIKAPVIVEAANGPTTLEADAVMEGKKIVVPDILANSGGVIASYVEWRKAKSGAITKVSDTYETIDSLIADNFEKCCHFSAKEKCSLKIAAQAIAVKEVVNALQERAWI
ncbi:Glu/Leu/Phe/Val dehydrogenase [bacterium]|nr:Glu/Leu/Phe/Val dehydrogenase [bacterium]